MPERAVRRDCEPHRGDRLVGKLISSLTAFSNSRSACSESAGRPDTIPLTSVPLPRGRPVRISVIVPTLNEESCLADMLRQVRCQRPHEIIVVDGGSQDDTLALAGAADVVLHAAAGRAVQMNCGAEHASGDVLLFLHADCVPEPGALAEIELCLASRGVVAGCFRMRVQARGLLYRSIDWCATTRVRLTGLAYGDQGLFLPRSLFAELGGFPTVRLMEDLLFSRKLRQRGRLVVAPRRIFVSPRRWQRAGLIRQTLRNWALTALAATGVHPDRLAAFYPAVR
jgi:rSAM/selenodomain-associated transferase 2